MGNEVMDLVIKIDKRAALFAAEAAKDTNKSAARRARKESLALEKLLKEYRKKSIK